MQRLKAMITTLLMSFGTPMMLAGDEFAHTQFGNNNPYCQDNVLTWIAWDAISKENKDLVKYVRRVITLRKKLKIFNRRHFFEGKIVNKGYKDLTWYNEQGKEFTTDNWHDVNRKSISYCVYTGSRFVMVILNANYSAQNWKLPAIDTRYKWTLLLDSSAKFDVSQKLGAEQIIQVPSWSVLVFEIKK